MKIKIILFLFFCNFLLHSQAIFTPEELQNDFLQFRDILENEHCCTYEYTSKTELDSLFDAHYDLLDHPMLRNEFFQLLAPITAKIGCMHTASWMPGRFYVSKPDMMFPLIVMLIEDKLVVSGSYLPWQEVPRGSIILEINGRRIEDVMSDIRSTISADALNPYFVDAKLMQRFSLRLAAIYGLPDQYKLKYLPPEVEKSQEKILTPCSHDAVQKVVFSHFSSPPLQLEIMPEKDAAIMTVSTFSYYARVDYFRSFMDSCFQQIKQQGINNLILDLRGNGGGDPFCSTILLSYLQKEPVRYFAEPYGKYEEFAKPLPLPEDHFTGNLYTLIDGSCGSTNGHFCALLKYHNLGKFIGTPSGSTYKCNAGKDTEFRLQNTQMIITIGRSTYAAAVENMDKSAPIMPDVLVNETVDDFMMNRDRFMITAFEQIRKNSVEIE